jgi:hypothetical protein
MNEYDSPQTVRIVTRSRPPSEVLDEAAAEIERLRLTDAEREAIERAILELDGIMQEFIPTPVEMRLKRHVATLRGLLERARYTT